MGCLENVERLIFNCDLYFLAECEPAPSISDSFFSNFKTRAFVSYGRGAPWTTLAAALRMRKGIKMTRLLAKNFHLGFLSAIKGFGDDCHSASTVS
jgi:hypothetical protein